MGSFEFLAKFIREGGQWAYPILAASAFALAVTIERFVFLYVHCRINAKELLTQITKMARAGEIEKARKVCARMKNPLAIICECALWHFQQQESDQEIQNAVDEVGLRELPKIQRRTHYLSLFANISTLLGLLGTIFGMQESFSALATADPSQKATLLAKGIAMAMNTTALGLIVAVPCMIVYSIFGAKTNTIIEEIDESSVRLLNFLFNLRRQ